MDKYDRKIMAERIKALRQEKNLGQNALAKAIMVSNASISYWETCKQDPSAEAIFKLATFFKVSADYILGITDY